MDESAYAAKWLNANPGDPIIQRVLLTGIVVSYGRPFTNQGVGAIDHVKFAPGDPEGRRLHDRRSISKQLYAHTDVTNLRFVAQGVRDFMGMPHAAR